MEDAQHTEWRQLLARTRNGPASAEDYNRLIALLNADESGTLQAELDAWLASAEVTSYKHVQPYDRDYWQQAFMDMRAAARRERRSTGRWVRIGWAAAAAILVGISGLLLWPAKQPASENASANVENKQDVPPGTEGAVLTLADGTKLTLDSLNSGWRTLQQGTQVSLEDDRVVYDQAPGAQQTMAYNTMQTPRGRQFQVVLPDGTRAWLNAASSITFPVSFDDRERRIRISGEVYLEVAADARRPFYVQVNELADIAVLGTSFNVHAYPGEAAIRATLLSGRIRVSRTGVQEPVTLLPGQQARVPVAEHTALKVVDVPDVSTVIAWKNGLFNFEGLQLPEVLKQLERWYDIRVEIKGTASGRIFRGKMYRNVNLSDVLEILRKMGVQYNWDGETLTVY
ncbi:FecR family protein [Chitinophaga cymbidii]|uniref:Iron dicitrate transporter FecR n=1 Tax=Chitinophaga cymbidii TaxID=1096750 RepID=A0A512RQX8_9BACT|nr:FecR family protein [Chitinophaga cymbidii]GEP98074.1 iron dicitrate transporter FecR [Chitinophaga cymbidii]